MKNEKDHRKEKGWGLAVSKQEFEKMQRVDKAYNKCRKLLKEHEEAIQKQKNLDFNVDAYKKYGSDKHYEKANKKAWEIIDELMSKLLKACKDWEDEKRK